MKQPGSPPRSTPRRCTLPTVMRLLAKNVDAPKNEIAVALLDETSERIGRRPGAGASIRRCCSDRAHAPDVESGDQFTRRDGTLSLAKCVATTIAVVFVFEEAGGSRRSARSSAASLRSLLGPSFLYCGGSIPPCAERWCSGSS